ncbi:MAG TPA: Ig-like domain-containing protein [Treponemataceae bacterium]|nr:Ig-like domain-containing protein [Treponemataceae bacterium]
MKKKCFMFVLCALTALAVYAGGKKELVEKEAEDLNSWEEYFDITEKKSGKYNIVVTASDQGGNVALGGPYNIFIDPESDLPIVGITNPLPEQRVTGNLNIVGTCIDDDAVERVEIIFDGDEENPKHAEGKDFWSFYLDTTEMTEGAHSLEVYGYDINGLRGRSKFVTWHLDRKMPVTEVRSHAIGDLVSGKVNFKGTVFDGNTVSQLWYSVDDGETFTELPVKYNKKENVWTFNLSIKTSKMEDGPMVCWFKALDGQGTYGVYSYLFFIDNTAPEVQFLYPEEDVAVNGEFIIAGVARDTSHIESLEWQVGKETGEFVLVPGNPYWTKTLDARVLGGKRCDVHIIATDTAGNKTIVKRRIPFDFEADKPTLEIISPVPDQEIYDSLLLQGTAFDDDGIASIIYSLDGGEEKTIPSEGVFSTSLVSKGAVLPAGKHVLSVRGVDIFGLEGDSVEIPFIARGDEPVFVINSEEYTSGIQIHPESGSIINVSAHSECGIERLRWNFKGQEEKIISPKKPQNTIKFDISFGDAPWGVVPVDVYATDIYGRESHTSLLFNVMNLTKIYSEPTVVFTDSCIVDNVIDFTNTNQVTGYFTGGQAVSVVIEPENDYVKASLKNNGIIITRGSAGGISEPFVVRVTTEKDLSYDSKKLVAKTPTAPPRISLNKNRVLNGFENLVIKGSVKTDTALKNTKHRLLTAHMKQADGTRVATSTGDTLFANLELDADTGEFTITYNKNQIPEGVSIVEIISTTAEGVSSVESIIIQKIPSIPEPAEGEKPKKLEKPLFDWIVGEQIYYTCIYQGEYSGSEVLVGAEPATALLFAQGGIVSKKDLTVGSNSLTATVIYEEGKTAKSTYTYVKEGSSSIEIVSVDEQAYVSGMTVAIPAKIDKQNPHSLQAVVYSPYKISKAFASINDVSVSAKIKKAEESNKYVVTLPLAEIPVGIASISVGVEVPKMESISCSGSLSIIREAPLAGIFDAEQVYMVFTKDLPKTEDGGILLKKNESLTAFANIPSPVSVRLEPDVAGLSASVHKNTVAITALVDGIYNDITLIATDRDGFEYSSPVFSVLVDTSAPTLNLFEDYNGMWVQKALEIGMSAEDANSVANVSVSIDGGNKWIACSKSDASDTNEYSCFLDLSALEDGIVLVSVKAIDIAGRQTIQDFVLAKDTKAPVASVILPPAGDTINGETTILILPEDDGKIIDVTSFVGVPNEKTSENDTVELTADPVTLNFIPLAIDRIGTKERPLADDMEFRITDAAGNVGVLNSYDFIIDEESDKPVVEIHVPERNTVITSDFEVSGVVYDDDGPCKIWYALDDDGLLDSDAFTSLDGYSNSYSITVPLSSLTDNEHWITVFAEDIHGVRSDPESIPFRVSLEEPKATVLEPAVGVTVHETATISGTSSDKNGIEKVQISIDNGNTYNDAIGTENWNYTFDTRLVDDGTHVVFVRVYDKYGIVGLYSSLINIDNTDPDLQLDLPLDGSVSTGNIYLSGQTMDNIGLAKLSVSINALGKEGKEVPASLSHIILEVEDIIGEVLDISALEDGFYNVELTGSDAAGNVSRVSRNIKLNTKKPATVASLMYPMNGEYINGIFNIYGQAESENPICKVMLYVDEKLSGETELSPSGYFKFTLNPEEIAAGLHDVHVKVITEDGQSVASNNQTFEYMPAGPWVSIDNLCMGDFVYDRPFLKGSAGYVYTERDVVVRESKDATKEEKREVAAKAVKSIEISFDNGKTFKELGGSEKWRYRIEDEEMLEGYHFMIVRAIMKNGDVAVTKSIIQIDKTAPTIKLVSPEAGGRYNQELRFAGLSSDDVKLDSVIMALRSGDKSSYEVPAFIQGLYFDAHFFGATLFDVGLGLTFFDDNVKLQAQYGQLTQSQYEMLSHSEEELRYGGDVFGGKIIANIGFVPFRYFFGPDWAWLSASFGVGANFSYFSETQSNRGQILSAVIGQLEFPRVTLADQKFLSTFSFYTEGQLWFIPTDIESTEDIKSLVPQISCGLRVNIF